MKTTLRKAGHVASVAFGSVLLVPLVVLGVLAYVVGVAHESTLACYKFGRLAGLNGMDKLNRG